MLFQINGFSDQRYEKSPNNLFLFSKLIIICIMFDINNVYLHWFNSEPILKPTFQALK